MYRLVYLLYEMKLEALEFEFLAQTVENKKRRGREAERRKECAVGFGHLLAISSFCTMWE